MARRWGVSLGSLASGVLVLFVFRRGLPHVGWIVGYAAGLGLLFAGLTAVRARLLARGRHGVVSVWNYTIQTMSHGLLLFVLPGYLASTTFGGITTPFFVLLAGVALLTTIDPWYHALVHPRPWLARGLFAFALFAGLNVAWPLVGLRPGAAVPGSAALAALGLAAASVPTTRSWWRLTRTVGTTVGLGLALGWVTRPAIPPVPLSLVGATVARDVVELEPMEPARAVRLADLRAWGGLAAYTPVVAPAGLHETVLHRWRHAGGAVSVVRLPTPVRGGRSRGFRTFSRKTDFPPDPVGRWTVDVLTASGQLVGRLHFTVTG
jgi:hypothetical protein